MLKFYGVCGLGKQVDRKVESLQYFAKRVRQHSSFMCACDPWPFNVNFFYLPKRIRKMLDEAGISTNELNPILPHNISDELANVTVKLKLLMHEAGEMLIPYQVRKNLQIFLQHQVDPSFSNNFLILCIFAAHK